MKILVCGSSTFEMANFMRYIMYRSKDHVFTSVDPLLDQSDFDMVYQNRRHNIHVGDPRDSQFMDKVLRFEKPDIVVAGPMFSDPLDMVSYYVSLRRSVAPWELFEFVSQNDQKAWQAANMISQPSESVLELCHCFGSRDRLSMFAKMLVYAIENGELVDIEFDEQKNWCFIEDAASLAWYMIERMKRHRTKMPHLGQATTAALVGAAANHLGIEAKGGYVEAFSQTPYPDWQPDSTSMTEAVCKTAEWYNKNRWFLKFVQ